MRCRSKLRHVRFALLLTCVSVQADLIYDPMINESSCTGGATSVPLLGFHDLGYGQLANGRRPFGWFFVSYSSVPESGSTNSAEAMRLDRLGWHVVSHCTLPADYWEPFQTPSGYWPSLYFKETTVSSPVNLGRSCAVVEGGLNTASGSLFRIETDRRGNPAGIQFQRFYNSSLSLNPDEGFRHGWSHTYSRSIIERRQLGAAGVTLTRPDGKALYFHKLDGHWTSDSDHHGRLDELLDPTTQITVGWIYSDSDSTIERFSGSGLLQSITDRRGYTHQLHYDENKRLLKVEGAYGDFITFEYGANNEIVAISDQAGRRWQYRYDAGGHLIFADQPDGTTRQYHYENLEQPHTLTGITDERNIRSATFAYHADGRLQTTSSDTVNSATITYNDEDLSRVVVKSLGSAEHYTIRNHLGRALISNFWVSPCDSTCTGL